MGNQTFLGKPLGLEEVMSLLSSNEANGVYIACDAENLSLEKGIQSMIELSKVDPKELIKVNTVEKKRIEFIPEASEEVYKDVYNILSSARIFSWNDALEYEHSGRDFVDLPGMTKESYQYFKRKAFLFMRMNRKREGIGPLYNWEHYEQERERRDQMEQEKKLDETWYSISKESRSVYMRGHRRKHSKRILAYYHPQMLESEKLGVENPHASPLDLPWEDLRKEVYQWGGDAHERALMVAKRWSEKHNTIQSAIDEVRKTGVGKCAYQVLRVAAFKAGIKTPPIFGKE